MSDSSIHKGCKSQKVLPFAFNRKHRKKTKSIGNARKRIEGREDRKLVLIESGDVHRRKRSKKGCQRGFNIDQKARHRKHRKADHDACCQTISCNGLNQTAQALPTAIADIYRTAHSQSSNVSYRWIWIEILFRSTGRHGFCS